MMNDIYGRGEPEVIGRRQKRLIIYYAIFAVLFVSLILLLCLGIENNVLLTAAFALLSLAFLLFSIVFWKIKYGILREYSRFLENLEIGKRDDYVGSFVEKQAVTDEGDSFDSYVFLSSGKITSFLIHKGHPVDFSHGECYHLEHIGGYLYRWEKVN